MHLPMLLLSPGLGYPGVFLPVKAVGVTGVNS
jgi:hypothetical protein